MPEYNKHLSKEIVVGSSLIGILNLIQQYSAIQYDPVLKFN